MVGEIASEPLLRWIAIWPLLGALVHGVLLGVLQRPLGRRLVVTISCGTPLLSLLCAGVAFAKLVQLPGSGGILLDTAYTWIGANLNRIGERKSC